MIIVDLHSILSFSKALTPHEVGKQLKKKVSKKSSDSNKNTENWTLVLVPQIPKPGFGCALDRGIA